MMFKLNQRIKTVTGYTPPVEIRNAFELPDPNAPLSDQIEQLLWIPGMLVGRFLAQFNGIKHEGDELFSIGCLRISELVSGGEHEGEDLISVAHRRCIWDMEAYLNNLDSIVSVGTSTRYKNRRSGVQTPGHMPLCDKLTTTDDRSDVIIRDACNVLGYEPGNLSLKQKRRIAKLLDLPS